MRRVLEAMDSWSGRAVVITLAICAVIWSFFASIMLIINAIGPSWAEQCIAKGGHYSSTTHYAVNGRHGEDVTEKGCELGH